ncbi:MAG: dienelactone hydrolase family protein [Oligoflexales bacterium]
MESKKTRKSSREFPQELWRSFDRYVHGDIDRRTFLNSLQKFAVGGITATALFEALQPDFALAVQVSKDDKRIKAETVTVNSPEGNGKITGYLAVPAQSKSKTLPGVLVVHENRGLNPYIEDVARRLATEGFVAYAPDGLTSVGGYPGDEDKGRELFKKVDEEKMTKDFEAAARWLKARPDSNGKLGVVGFCFGGKIANTLAVRMSSDLQAAVPFYGSQPKAEDVAKIKAALLIHDASLDERIVAGWPAYEAALKANKINYKHYMYEKAQHGFHNDTTPRYDEASAKLAWTRTIEFFKEYLK